MSAPSVPDPLREAMTGVAMHAFYEHLSESRNRGEATSGYSFAAGFKAGRLQGTEAAAQAAALSDAKIAEIYELHDDLRGKEHRRALARCFFKLGNLVAQEARTQAPAPQASPEPQRFAITLEELTEFNNWREARATATEHRADYPPAEEPQALREAAKVARALLAENLAAFGPCDHDVGICNCDIQRGIDALDAALAASPGVTP